MKRIVLSVCAAVAAAVVAQAETYTWTGGTGTWNANSGASWTATSTGGTGTVPGADDAVIIPAAEAAYTVTVTEPFTVGSLEVGANAKLCFSHREMNTVGGDVHVLAGGVITHTALPTNANTPAEEKYRVALSVGGDMTIEEGAIVDARSRGMQRRRGPVIRPCRRLKDSTRVRRMAAAVIRRRGAMVRSPARRTAARALTTASAAVRSA